MDATGRPSQQIINAQKELARRRQLAGVSYQPPTVRNAESATDPHSRSVPTALPVPNSQLTSPNSQFPIRISPTLAANCLDKHHRHQNASLDGPYRLYKILQALDEHGRGWLANVDVEPLLTKKESPFYIYGRRQLKIILRRGEGLFWQRVKSRGQMRIRLVSRAKLITSLSSGSRLRGKEVEIPLSYLLGSGRGRQADVNAALYAAVHAGRLRPDRAPSGREKPRPISRARLQELAGCSNYRQRSYERRMKITVERNIHILGAHNEYEMERARRHLGLPVYKHTDYQGKINRHRRGAAYIAVRLPNSYHLPQDITVVHSQRQRTINRFLDGLCHLGSGGSDREEIVRLYHRDAATAVRATQSDQHTPAYWPMLHNSGARLWQTYQVRSNDFSRQSDESLTTNPVEQSGTAAELRNASLIPNSQLAVNNSQFKGGDLD